MERRMDFEGDLMGSASKCRGMHCSTYWTWLGLNWLSSTKCRGMQGNAGQSAIHGKIIFDPGQIIIDGSVCLIGQLAS